MTSAVTLFTAPKPFTDPRIARLQGNALRSWKALRPEIEVLVIGDEDGAAEAARATGCRFVPDVDRNPQGTPLISSLFERARAVASSTILAYANADILLLDDFLPPVSPVAQRFPRFLLATRRWDLRVEEALTPEEGWQDRLQEQVRLHATRHPPAGSDVFVFPRDCYTEVPPLAVGRAGWDNWMIYEARRRRWPVVDMTGAWTVIHQEHDYRHLPGGQPHYRLPETDENVRLAGGRRAILTLLDADWEWRKDGVRRRGTTLGRLVRSVELFPLLRLRSSFLANLTYAVVHPGKALRDVRGWLAWRLKGAARGPAARPGR